MHLFTIMNFFDWAIFSLGKMNLRPRKHLCCLMARQCGLARDTLPPCYLLMLNQCKPQQKALTQPVSASDVPCAELRNQGLALPHPALPVGVTLPKTFLIQQFPQNSASRPPLLQKLQQTSS